MYRSLEEIIPGTFMQGNVNEVRGWGLIILLTTGVVMAPREQQTYGLRFKVNYDR